MATTQTGASDPATQAIQPHEITLEQFTSQAQVERQGAVWKVQLGDHYQALAGAATEQEAIAEAHHAAVNNALLRNLPGHPEENMAAPRLPPAEVLAQYPDLVEKYPEVAQMVLPDRSAEALEAQRINDLATNTVEHEPEKKPEEIDAQEMLDRIARVRAGQRQLEQNELARQIDNKHLIVENLAAKAQIQDDANLSAERVGATTDYAGQVMTEREKNRQAELMRQVHQQFRVAGPNFHFKDDPKRVAFTDKGRRMVSNSNDERVAHAMAMMSEARGWKTIRVSGHPDFKREVWMEASLRGIEVRGFKPDEKDLAEFEARLEARARNTIEQEEQQRRDRQPKHSEAEASQATKVVAAAVAAEAVSQAVRAYSGRIVDHGKANYKNDPEEKVSYFVKLATAKGEEIVWGVDLPRALAEGKAKTGDDVRLEFLGKQRVTVTALERDKDGKVIGSKEIQTNRNTWEVQKSDRAKVVEAVAAEVFKGHTPQKRDAIMKAISTKLEQREKEGRVPLVPIYDKSAPSVQAQQARTRPQIERNAERTR